MPLPDLDKLSLDDLLRLQEEISRVLVRRFQREIALVFTDVVGSTSYYERFGDAAGKALVDRSHALLAEAMHGTDGRVVDTAGDGAFAVFGQPETACRVLIDFQNRVARTNETMPEQQRLSVRTGVHWGPALLDGPSVSGDSVNYAARVSGAAGGDDIFVSEAAAMRLPPALRYRCHRLPPVELKGVSGQVRLYSLMWLDPEKFPDTVSIVETMEQFAVPMQARIRFGRLDRFQGDVANEIVLRHPDPEKARFVSRWHFELERTVAGYELKLVSRTPVRVDGRQLEKGESAPLTARSVVEVAGVLTLQFKRQDEQTHLGDTRGPWGNWSE